MEDALDASDSTEPWTGREQNAELAQASGAPRLPGRSPGHGRARALVLEASAQMERTERVPSRHHCRPEQAASAAHGCLSPVCVVWGWRGAGAEGQGEGGHTGVTSSSQSGKDILVELLRTNPVTLPRPPCLGAGGRAEILGTPR